MNRCRLKAISTAAWDNEQFADQFADIGYDVSQDIGELVAIELCDDEFKTRRSCPMKVRDVVSVGEHENILFVDGVTRGQAEAAAEAFNTLGFMSGEGRATVLPGIPHRGSAPDTAAKLPGGAKVSQIPPGWEDQT